MNRKEEGRCLLEVDLDVVRDNVISIKHYIKDTMLMSVVKADAYGMGLSQVAKSLEDLTDWYGVATASEAFTIRSLGIKKPILVLGFVSDEEILRVVNEDITICTISQEYIEHINSLVPQGKELKVHIKIDTGLNRIGLFSKENKVEEYVEQAESIYRMKSIHVTGIYTHFAVSESKLKEDIAFTLGQYQLFKKVYEAIEAKEYNVGIKHICNSNAIIEYPELYLDMVRTGKFLFGFGQNKDVKQFPVRLAFKLLARIVRVETIKIGDSIGYGRSYVADKATKVATISFGFADGYRRQMSEDLEVLVQGKRAKVLGRIAMDYMMVDVSDIPNVAQGEYAVLIGHEGNDVIMPNEIARHIKGSTPEISSQLSARVPKVYCLKSNEKEAFK